jgi:ADP-ribose pyrophosphatase YjhB (NUDIX family)
MKVGVNVAIIQNKQVLLTKRPDFGVWCLPGGHVDAGESVAQAAIREAFEETGLKIQLNRLVGIYSIPEARAWVNLIVVFAGHPVGGEFKPQEDDVLEMAFFDFGEIPNNLLWGHQQRVQDAFDENCMTTVWLQNVPFNPLMNRQELYKLRDESGLSGLEFYAKHFGWVTSDGDRQEIG